MRILPCLLLLTLAACDLPDVTKTDGSASAATSAKPATSGAGASDKGTAEPAGAAAPPADPLDDAGKPEAACESIKETGGCIEHYNLGFGAESRQKMCESSGRWTKGGTCPKADRVAVCTTLADRTIYYPSTFSPGNTVKDIGKLCTETMSGKFAEFPKKK